MSDANETGFAEKKVESTTASDLEKYTSQQKGSLEDIGLSQLGLKAETTREIGALAIISTGWNICNSWAGIAATMALSIASGGPVTLIYGIIVVFILGGSSAASMAELASVYPTAGGQYHWTSLLAPKKWSRVLSYCCGAVNVFAWIATTAGVAVAVPQQIVGLAAFWHPTYVPQQWHVFLIYQALMVILTLYNIFAMKRTVWIQDVGFAISLLGFFVVFVTCLARSSPKQSSELVWNTFENSTGWSSSGVVFLTGLVNPNYVYAGLDGAVHLAEECKNAATAVPRALMSTVAIGFVTGFAFAVAMTYSYTDFNAVLASPLPILEIFNQATRSKAAATVFTLIITVCGLFALAGSIQTSSRLTWSFARDDAVLGSRWLSRIHPRLLVPVWALLANFVVVFIIGCIYLGSTTAFNAMIGTSLILMHLSFAFPTALLMYQRRSSLFLPSGRSFKLGAFGWVTNALTVVMAVLVLIFYNFPVFMPVTAGNMNYASAVLGVMAIFSVVNWFGYANSRYHGPRIEILE